MDVNNEKIENSSKKWVFIRVLDKDWNELNVFQADKESSLAWQANKHNCNIMIACGSWACMVCACEIVKGEEYIDKEKFWKQLINPWDNRILSCIAGVKDEFLNKDWYYEIVIKKLL